MLAAYALLAMCVIIPTTAYAQTDTLEELVKTVDALEEIISQIKEMLADLEMRMDALESRLDSIQFDCEQDVQELYTLSGNYVAAEPSIPPYAKDLTQCYTDGSISTDEYTGAIRHLMDEGAIYFGEPDLENANYTYGMVTKNIDGNTIDVNNTRIRLSMVDVVDSGNSTAPHAVLAEILCPVGTPAHYDIDDKQPTGYYGRTIALVYCNNGVHLGEIMMEFGLGKINDRYCDRSEFKYADWTRGACWS